MPNLGFSPGPTQPSPPCAVEKENASSSSSSTPAMVNTKKSSINGSDGFIIDPSSRRRSSSNSGNSSGAAAPSSGRLPLESLAPEAPDASPSSSSSLAPSPVPVAGVAAAVAAAAAAATATAGDSLAAVVVACKRNSSCKCPDCDMSASAFGIEQLRQIGHRAAATIAAAAEAPAGPVVALPAGISNTPVVSRVPMVGRSPVLPELSNSSSSSGDEGSRCAVVVPASATPTRGGGYDDDEGHAGDHGYLRQQPGSEEASPPATISGIKAAALSSPSPATTTTTTPTTSTSPTKTSSEVAAVAAPSPPMELPTGDSSNNATPSSPSASTEPPAVAAGGGRAKAGEVTGGVVVELGGESTHGAATKETVKCSGTVKTDGTAKSSGESFEEEVEPKAAVLVGKTVDIGAETAKGGSAKKEVGWGFRMARAVFSPGAFGTDRGKRVTGTPEEGAEKSKSDLDDGKKELQGSLFSDDEGSGSSSIEPGSDDFEEKKAVATPGTQKPLSPGTVGGEERDLSGFGEAVTSEGGRKKGGSRRSSAAGGRRVSKGRRRASNGRRLSKDTFFECSAEVEHVLASSASESEENSEREEEQQETTPVKAAMEDRPTTPAGSPCAPSLTPTTPTPNDDSVKVDGGSGEPAAAAVASPTAAAEEIPLAVAHSPVVVAHSPVAASHSPVAAAYSPGVAAQSPMVATKSPVVAAKSPAATASTVSCSSSEVVTGGFSVSSGSEDVPPRSTTADATTTTTTATATTTTTTAPATTTTTAPATTTTTAASATEDATETAASNTRSAAREDKPPNQELDSSQPALGRSSSRGAGLGGAGRRRNRRQVQRPDLELAGCYGHEDDQAKFSQAEVNAKIRERLAEEQATFEKTISAITTKHEAELKAAAQRLQRSSSDGDRAKMAARDTEALEREIAMLSERFGEAAAEARTNGKALREKEALLDAVTAQLMGLKTEILSARKEHAAEKRAVQEAAEAERRLRSAAEGSLVQLDAAYNKLEDTEREKRAAGILKMKLDMQGLARAQFAEANKKHVAVKARLEAAEAESAKLRESSKGHDAQLKAAATTADDLGRQVETLQQAREERAAEASQMERHFQEDIEALRNDADMRMDELDAMSVERDSANKERDVSQDALARMAIRNAQMKETVADLEGKVKELEEFCTEALDELDREKANSAALAAAREG